MKRIRLGIAAVALVCLGLAGPAAHAHDGAGILHGKLNFIALLTSGQVTGAVLPTSNASGMAFLTFDKKARELCFTISYQGLEGTELAGHMGAHIHGPARAGEGNPIHIVSLHEFGSGSPRNGCAILEKPEMKAVLESRAYIQVHTDAYPTGELRGQIVRMK